MEQGIAYYNEGDITQAIRCFEYVTKDQVDNAEAWRWLGQCWAQHEEDKLAIAALRQCITIDPYNTQALLMLGVSYTNNLNNQQALTYLRTWIENNPQYIDLVNSLHDGVESDTDTLQDHVVRMYQRAVEKHPEDYHLWTVLGVLHHINSEYDQAIASFQEAIKLHDDDSELWNKLGATLSNAGKPAEGVEALQRALQLRPRYVRARANLGISYYNQGQHWKAATSFLSCLTQNSSPSHLWIFLRMSFNYLGRDDLADLVKFHDPELFRPHISF
uniref:Peroxisome biogenesis protein 5 n=1 Tax=Lygus hesperus TaxID=30085 RepID=A0A0A9Z525_LYGHE